MGEPITADEFRAAMAPRVICYQLSLLGDEPKRGLAWRPTFWSLTICGEQQGPDDDAKRHVALMISESRAPVPPRTT